VRAAVRLGRSLAAVAVALTATVSVPASAAASTGTPAPVPPGFVGMVADGPLFPVTAPGVDLGAQFGRMVATGVQSIRAAFDWSYAQPYFSWSQVPPADLAEFTDVGGIPTRFSELDALVGAAAQRGLTVLPVVLYAPLWDAAPHSSATFAIPASDGPYASFLTALVHRYGPHGTFWLTHRPAVPIRMWQIWNEPNITTFWPAQPFAQSYVALLRAAHAAIKQADPGAKVVLAGLPDFSWLQLAKIYRIAGARRLFDVVAVHPYTRDPKGVITIIQNVRRVMDEAGDGRKPIVADEVSWPSSLGKTSDDLGLDFATNEAGQARKLAALLPLLGEDRRSLHLLGFYYYTWAGIEDRGGLAFDFAGLLRFSSGVFTAKPALAAFRDAALALEGCRRKGRIATVCLQT
jgi:hypothetical protein